MEYRHFLGLVERSNEVVVGTTDGCYKVNNIKRLPERQQKNTELFKSVLGVPWRLRPSVARNHEDEDLEGGDIPTMVATAPIVPEDELPPRVEARVREREKVPRRLYIRGGVDLDTYGYTDGCPGCERAKARGLPLAHNETCRAWIEARIDAEDEERRAKLIEIRADRGETDAPAARLRGPRELPEGATLGPEEPPSQPTGSMPSGTATTTTTAGAPK